MSKIINGYKIVEGVFESGSVSLPSVRNIAGLTTGVYFPSTTTVGVSVSGTEKARFTTNGLGVVDGTVSLPSYTFTSDTNTGMYSGGADTIRFTTGGANRVTVNSTGLVGINTIDPKYQLHMQTTGEVGSYLGVFMNSVLGSSVTDYNSVGGNGGKGFLFYGTSNVGSYAAAQISLDAAQTITFYTGPTSAPPTIRAIIGTTGGWTLTPGVVAAAGGAGTTGWTLTPAAHTGVGASTVDWTVAAHTMTVTGAITGQSFSVFGQPTITAASGITVTNASTVSIVAPTTAASAIITNTTALSLGSATTGVLIADVAGNTYANLKVIPQTVTLAGTTTLSGSPSVSGISIGTITVGRTGATSQATNVASFYVANAPQPADGSVTLTNPYSAWFDAGRVRVDAGLQLGVRTAGAGAVTVNKDTDFYIGKTAITGGGDTVTLPSAVTAGAGSTFVVKDQSGGAAANNITVATSGGNIDGVATKVITTNYGSYTVVSDGTNYFII